MSHLNKFANQAEYEAAYQTGGASPFKLKFGSVDSPQYYDFTTMREFQDFYFKCIEFINATLQEGWVAKGSIDWSKYDFSS